METPLGAIVKITRNSKAGGIRISKKDNPLTYNIYTDASVMVNDDFRAGVGLTIYCNETKSIEMSVGFNIGEAPTRLWQNSRSSMV